jgi:hypothetical protein
MSKRKTKKPNMKQGVIDLNEPLRLPDKLGPEVKAWIFGAAAKGLPAAGSRLDVYISGPGAEALERGFFGKRPLVVHAGDIYAMRLIGPTTVSEEVFVREHPEAVRIL